MAEEKENIPKKTVAERQNDILVAALEKAEQNGGVLMNASSKTMPVLMDKQHMRVSPVNALMMAMHADLNEAKTNVYTQFSEAKSRGESVRSGMKGVPFTWKNNSEYVSKENPDDKISKKDFLTLPDADKEKYAVNPKEDVYILFNIDQTTMPSVNKGDYGKQIAAHGGADVRSGVVDDKQMRINVNQFILSMRDNLVKVAKDGSGVAHYDPVKDTVYMPAQKEFPSYGDYVQETVRQIAQATGIPQRLNRPAATAVASIEAQKEALVVELASAHKMLELGMPAKLRPETMNMMPAIIANLKENPQMTEDVMKDVSRTVGMIKKAESGEKINLITKPSEQRQQKWAEQFPIDKVPENFAQIVMLKDDEGKWTLVAKPENERTFAVHPTKEDVSMFFDVIKNDQDEAHVAEFKTQFAQKYYNEVAKDPGKEVNIFLSNAPQEALDLISKVNAFKSKDSKIFLIASIGDEKQKPVELNQTQWNRMFLADDKRDYKLHLAATLYADVLNEKLEEQKHADYHKEEDQHVAQEKQKEEKIKNSPEQKEKEKQEEKAKEEATKQETKAVAVIALSPMLKQFMDLKKKHPDALLLFRCGDFYETYMQDAEKASKILGITLTKSSKTKDPEGKPLAMAGFPYHALDTYLPKLIRAGQRVAICDQIEAPRQQAQQSSEQSQKEEVKQEQKQGKEETQSRGFHR